jgi:hypothetical protein
MSCRLSVLAVVCHVQAPDDASFGHTMGTKGPSRGSTTTAAPVRQLYRPAENHTHPTDRLCATLSPFMMALT